MTSRFAFAIVLAVACSDGAATPVQSTTSDFSFDGVGEDGRAKTIRLSDYATPDTDGVLVVRVEGGAWCGTCLGRRLTRVSSSIDRAAIAFACSIS